MTASIREAKSKLSELIDSAERGEEVIITAHGKPRAKLVPIPKRTRRGFDMDKLRRLAKRGSTGKKGGPGSTKIISDLREDRL